jgi:uncharacterized protein with von Willebrand factor type A (vWA) domain
MMGSVDHGKSSQWIEQEQVECGLSALQQLAKNRKKGFSLFDAIATMMPGIEKSFAAGYTHQEICETLKEKAGIAIAPSTLKLYINRIKKEKENQKGRRVKPKAIAKQQLEGAEKVTQQVSSSTPKPEVSKIRKPQPDGFVEMPDEL